MWCRRSRSGWEGNCDLIKHHWNHLGRVLLLHQLVMSPGGEWQKKMAGRTSFRHDVKATAPWCFIAYETPVWLGNSIARIPVHSCEAYRMYSTTTMLIKTIRLRLRMWQGSVVRVIPQTLGFTDCWKIRKVAVAVKFHAVCGCRNVFCNIWSVCVCICLQGPYWSAVWEQTNCFTSHTVLFHLRASGPKHSVLKVL